MRTVTLEETKTLLTELVTGKEDYVYERPLVNLNPFIEDPTPKCVNWIEKDGNRVGSCLVGQVFEKLGVLDDVNQTTSADDEAEILKFEGVIAFDEQAVRLLRAVQVEQDEENRWGEALKIGLARVEDEEED